MNVSDTETTSQQLMIVGGVDKITSHPARFEIHVEGRDYTSKLIDTKTSEKFSNYTTSDVAILLAKLHGLSRVGRCLPVKRKQRGHEIPASYRA